MPMPKGGLGLSWDMAVVKPGYQETRGSDIYKWITVAEGYAKRGGRKWVIFWLFDWLQLQGPIQIPPNSKNGEFIRVPAIQIQEKFYLRQVRIPGWMPGDGIPGWSSSGISPDTALRGDLFVVIEYKK